MFVSADTVPKNSIIQSDICIIGAGAAGLTLAKELENTKAKVCILEAGGLEFDHQTQSLHDLETTDLPISSKSRIRQFGGTTTVWMGLWRPHEEHDFSTWPIGFDDLRDYYQRAAILVSGPKLSDFNAKNYQDQLFLNDESIQTSIVWRLKKSSWDFGKMFRQELERSQNIAVYLNANVTRLISSAKNRIDQVAVKTLGGNEFQVQARYYVLSSGGIENARLLLVSNIGGEVVGRYYMDHPKGAAGRIKLTRPIRLPLYWSDGPVIAGLVLSDQALRQYNIRNSFLMLLPSRISFWGRLQKKLLNVWPKSRELIIRNFMEQSPDPDNRVELSENKDALGIPRAKISWKISEQDKLSLRKFHELLGEALVKNNLGELESPLLDPSPLIPLPQAGEGEGRGWPVVSDASHHMGTTRMGDDPKTSVVNKNCQVHGIDNLFVAGSSVFTTGGYANPTATIMALAVRLADHMKQLFSSPQPSPLLRGEGERVRRKKVLLIGSGSRAQSVVLPALSQLQDQFELVGVVARSKKQIEVEGVRYKVADSLDEIDWQKIDIVIVAITLDSVPEVIDKLVKRDVSDVTLMLDTPVLSHTRLGTLRKLRHFKKVLVSEDNFYLALYQQVKREISQGKIGKLKKIIFWHSGYRYHALAVLRLLTGARYIKKIKVVEPEGGEKKRQISLPGGIKAEIIEPRNYDIGRFIAEGEEGKLEYTLKSFGDMARMKIQGFAELLKHADAPEFDYSPQDAIYDNLCLKVSDKLGWFFDFSLGRKSFFWHFLSVLSNL